MNRLNKFMGAVAMALLIGMLLPVSAKAGATMTTYDFYGLCDDCLGEGGPATVPLLSENIDDGLYAPVTGTLMLVDYTPGTALQDANFVSFTYDGSSIVDPFTVSTVIAGELGGILDVAGNVIVDVLIVWDFSLTPEIPNCGGVGTFCGLAVDDDGRWSLGAFADVGIAGTFAGIPEPGTLALFGLGLAGLGFARRKRMI